MKLPFFKKQTDGRTVTLKIKGMHCTGCAMNIDGALEDIDGVKEACTNYARSETTVVYDEAKVSPQAFKDAIQKEGYKTEE